RHRDAPAGQVDFGRRVRIRIDAEHAAELEPARVPAPVEVEAPGIGIDLDGNAVLGASGEDPLGIDAVAFAAEELASGHVPENGRVRVGYGAKEAFGLR